jgi:hypothetical protein
MTERETDGEPNAANAEGAFRFFGTDVSTIASAKEATKAGAVAGVCLAMSYAFAAIFAGSTALLWLLQGLLGVSVNTFTDVVLMIGGAAVAAAFANSLWRDKSVVAATVIFAWIIAEGVAKAWLAPDTSLVIFVALFFGGLAGLRGAIALRKLARATDIEVF